MREDDGRTTWSLENVLKEQENGAMIYCVDWGSRGELLIAGEQLGIWKLNEQGSWVKSWNQRPATPIIKAQFSPSCSMFATLSKWDGLVTVWYESKEEDSLHQQYSFSYLSHASDTTNFDWRHSPHNDRHLEHDPTIFTMCKDGIGRFWSSMDPDTPHNLYMTAVIDPNQSLVTATEDEDFDCNSKENDAAFFPIHYMNSAELESAIQLCTADQGGQLSSKVRRIRDMIKDTPDMLFKVQKDGSLTIWGIQHLNEWPRRIPKVFVVLRVAQAIPSNDAIHFMSNVKIYHNHLGSKTSSSVNPVELFILTQGTNGQLSCYTINLIDFFDSTRFASQLYLRYSWLGHQSPIVDIQRCNHSNYFLTRSNDDNVAIWKYERPKFGTQTMYGLREKDFHIHVGKSAAVAIIRDDSYLAVSQGAKVYIYKRNSAQFRYESYMECPMPTDDALVDGLYCFGIPISESNDEKQYVLVGTSPSTSELFSWRVWFDDQSLQVEVLGTDSIESGWTYFTPVTKYAGPEISLDLHRSVESRFYFVTCQGSSMFFWTLRRSLEDIAKEGHTSDVWQSLGPLDCHLENITQISAMNNRAVAIVSTHSNGDTRLSIWSEIRTGYLPRHEADIDIRGDINGLSWCITSDSQALLAVAVGPTVQIYARKRIKDIQVDEGWALCDEMKLESDVTAVAWADAGVLVAASGQTLRTFSKWLTIEDKASEPMPTIYDVTFILNGPLPLFHPDVLVHYFLWGKLDLINFLMMTLYRFLHAVEHADFQFIKTMPPTILDKVLHLQNASATKKQGKQQYEFLWGDDDDKPAISDDDDAERPMTEKEANYLKERLNEKSMAFMNKIDRLHLIAQVDTLMHVLNRRNSVDENGARYMIFLKNFYFLNSIVDDDKKQDVLSYRDMIWASHSQSQDAILEFADTFIDKMVWKDARALGIFLWLDKADTMRQRMEAIARNTYLSQEDKDPVSSTLFYLALGKKSLVHTLWRTANHHKEQKAMLQFLANDFKEARWQTAASKNAFALLGKQRYEYAAAFFLLAGKLRDAVNVILKHLKDMQLAIAICRVYEGDNGPVLRDIITSHMLPLACRTDDRWLASLAFWMIDKTEEAVAATMISPQKLIDPDVKPQSMPSPTHLDPSLLILYQYLKEKTSQNRKKTYQITYDLEYEFLLDAARTYERIGCPLLSLYILTQYKISPPLVLERQSSFTVGNPLKAMDDASDPVTTGALDFEDWDSNRKDQKVARAADLFDDDDDATNPFASGSKQARAADLFADEPAQPSRAHDLFGDDEDIFASNKSPARDIFADFLPDNSEKPTSVETSSPAVTSKEEEIDSAVNLLDDENLYVYKGSLVVQMLQLILHSVAVISGDSEMSSVLAEEPFFKKYVLKVRSQFMELASTVKISENDFRNLLITKGVENDAFGLAVRVLDKEILESNDSARFMNAIEGGSNELLWLAFTHQNLTLSGILYVDKWARDSLSTYPVWGNVTSAFVPSADSKKTKILLASFTAILVTALRRRYYEQAWGFLSEMKGLLCSISKDKNEIPNVIRKCLSGDVKLIEMEPEDYEYFSDDSFRVYDLDEDQFKFDAQPSNSLASTLLELASLQLSLHTLETTLGNSDIQFSDDVTTFAVAGLLDPLAQRAGDLKKIALSLLGDDISRRNAVKQFKSTREKRFWYSLTTILPEYKLLPFLQFNQNVRINAFLVNPVSDCEAIFKSTSTVGGFCKNKVGDNILAICTGTEVKEIDLDKAPQAGPQPGKMSRTGSSSSASTQLQLEQTDLDTDDEMGADRHSLTDSVDNRKQGKKKDQHAQHSRAATPVSKFFQDDSTGEKMIRSSSFDNLQEAFKRSLKLNVKDNADPVGYRFPSPFGMDNSHEMDAYERSVSLRRKTAATSAESHPQFPFYVVGCDPADGKPSAVIWQYGHDRAVANYYGCQAKTSRVHFDRFGQKFGAGDMKGNLCLWRFDTSSQASKPYWTWNCHSKATRDFTFLDSSSLIASVGTSSALARNKQHVCLWDTLLPPQQSLICSIPAHELGAYAVSYSSPSQLLFSGGKSGEIVVTDVRQRTIMHTFQAHQSRIRSMTLDSEDGLLITGSIEGDMKIWDVNTFKLRQTIDAQPKNRFLSSGFTKIPVSKRYSIPHVSL
ncbi:unnamed protein product [Umbelopsis ramanniana]